MLLAIDRDAANDRVGNDARSSDENVQLENELFSLANFAKFENGESFGVSSLSLLRVDYLGSSREEEIHPRRRSRGTSRIDKSLLRRKFASNHSARWKRARVSRIAPEFHS